MVKPQAMFVNEFRAGKTGAGKTYGIQTEFIPNMFCNDFRPILILDPKNEYNMCHSIDIKNIGHYLELRDIMIGEYTRKQKFLIFKDKPVPLRMLTIKAEDMNPQQLDHIVFQYLCKTKDKVLIFEECSFYFNDVSPKHLTPWFKKLIRARTLKHNNNINILFSTQSPQDIPKIVLGQCDKGRIYKLKPVQLKYLYEKDFLEHKPEFYKYPEEKRDYQGMYYKVE